MSNFTELHRLEAKLELRKAMARVREMNVATLEDDVVLALMGVCPLQALNQAEKEINEMDAALADATEVMEKATLGFRQMNSYVLASGWRNIDTAPRDGTEIELARIETGKWIKGPPEYEDLGEMWELPDGYVPVDAAEFTHWRPKLQNWVKPEAGGAKS
jgi:hypothetical protein